MASNDIINEGLQAVVPNVSMSGWSDSLLILGIILIVGGALAVLSVWLVKYFKFNMTIKVFKRIGNQNVLSIIDKACLERVGNAGDYWALCKKTKKILPKPRLQMGKNEYWYYERDDGEWINFTLGNFDEQMKEGNAHYVDEDMRLQRLGIQRNLRDRFQKVSFWQRYGGMITSFLFVLVVSIMFIILAKEWSEAIQNTSSMAAAVKEMAIAVNNLRGSGAIPVG